VHTYGLRFDVNCSILFTELPLLKRPAAAKAAGFDGVEFWWPFAEPVPSDRDTDAFVGALDDAGVTLVSLNFAAGDMAAGVGCTRLNALYGNREDDVPACAQDELAAENLKLAADEAARIGATVLVEAINSYECPRYPVVSSDDAIAAIDRVDADNVAFLADLYHLARMDEDLPGALDRHGDRIGHVQIADMPGRGAPGTGSVVWETVFAELADKVDGGWAGLEYKPTDPADSSSSFGWLGE